MVVGVLVAAAQAVVTNFATVQVPDFFQDQGRVWLSLAVLVLLVVIVELLLIPVRTVASDVDELADRLAEAVRNQWSAAATERGLLEPTPLPIRWRRCSQPVVAGPPNTATTPRATGGTFDPLPGIDRITPKQLREGTHRTLHRIYGGLASGRLILTGGPGTGKSSAAILLLLDALRYRDQIPLDQRAQVPVPVLFTLHGWDPDSTPVQEWLATKLTELPPLTGRHGRQHATDFLTTGRIAVFLDGLDEIPESIRPTALQALSRQATTFRLVLLSRTTELATAAHQHILTGAAALELKPLTPSDAATYLEHGLTDPPPPPWQKLIRTLNTSTNGPLACALTSPLTITLLRDIYPPTPTTTTPTGTVDELLDTTRFPHPDDITHHLLDHAIAAAYTPQPGQPSPPYTPDTARHILTLIAQQLRDRNTRDLAWWTISDWIPRTPRTLISALLGTISGGLGGLVGGLAGGLVVDLERALTIGLTVGPAAMLVVGLVVGFKGTERPTPIRRFRWRQVRWRRFPTYTLAFGLVVGLAAMLVVGLAAGLAVGLVVGLVTGFMASFAEALGAPDTPRTVRPTDLRRGDTIFWLTFGLTFGLTLGLALGLVGWLLDDLATGLAAGFSLTPLVLGIAITGTGAWKATVSQIYLRLYHHAPLRLGHFLEDAHTRHLLRTVGPIYQFRHATLQDRLAPPPSPKPSASADD